MQRRALVLSLFLVASSAFAADRKIQPLPAEFLEYLSDLEGEEDDWTLVADDDKPAPTPAKPAEAKPPSKEAGRRSTDDKP
jgi:hypothetical protein